MKKVVWCILMVFCCALLLACDGPGGCDKPKTIELTEADNGQTVKMNLTDDIKVVLFSNYSTGYEWVNMLTEGSFIVQVGDSIYAPDPECIDRTGCGGLQTFMFEATQTGTGAIKLYYMRSWETEHIDEFAVTVIVE